MFLPKFRRRAVVITLSDYAKTNLVNIAQSLGCVGPSGKIHISEVIEAIGLYQLQIIEPLDSPSEEQGYSDGKDNECHPPVNQTEYPLYMKGYYRGLAHRNALERL